MFEVEKMAKTVDEAVLEALKELNISMDEADITVIDEGSKGFLGMFGGKNAVVKVKRKHDPERIAKDFLREIFLAMGVIVKVETTLKEKHAKEA